jgi:hypothetical protein
MTLSATPPAATLDVRRNDRRLRPGRSGASASDLDVIDIAFLFRWFSVGPCIACRPQAGFWLRQANGTSVYAPLEAMQIKSSLQLGSTGLGPPEQQSHDPVTLDGGHRSQLRETPDDRGPTHSTPTAGASPRYGVAPSVRLASNQQAHSCVTRLASRTTRITPGDSAGATALQAVNRRANDYGELGIGPENVRPRSRPVRCRGAWRRL